MTQLVVLGAGEDQLETYRAARRRGLPTIGVDMRADAPGAVLADRFLHLSTTDAAVAAALAGEPVVGVIAPAGDAAQPTVRKLALQLGLRPTVSAAAARCSSDKGAFRALVTHLGLPRYRAEQHARDADLAGAARRVGCPLVVKPSDSSGSKGVTLVTHPAALAAAVAEARRFSASGRVIVEQFVTGRHLSAECFLAAGELVLFVLSERTTTGPPGMITVTHRVPAGLSPAEHAGVRSVAATVAAGVGITDGPLNLDVIMAPDGTPYVVEMGSRLGGNGMPQLVELVHGVDTVAAAVAHACGEAFDVTPRFSRAAALHVLHTHRSGTLLRLQGLKVIEACPQVVAHELFVAPGDQIRPYVRAANKLGYVLLAGDELSVLDQRLHEIAMAFDVDLVPADEESGALPCVRS